MKMIIGGEVDAGMFLCFPPSPFTFPTNHILIHAKKKVWDRKPSPPTPTLPLNYIELKTTAIITTPHDRTKFERKLLKFWAQSFLLGVPKIIVGFRTKNGILERLEELETRDIPEMVRRERGGKGLWDGNVCIGFAGGFLDCEFREHTFGRGSGEPRLTSMVFRCV